MIGLNSKHFAIRFLNEGKFLVKADDYSDIFELSDNHDITINDVKKRIKIHYLLDEKYKYIMLQLHGISKHNNTADFDECEGEIYLCRAGKV